MTICIVTDDDLNQFVLDPNLSQGKAIQSLAIAFDFVL